MPKYNFTIDSGENIDPEAEVLKHLDKQRSKLDYSDSDDESEEIDFDTYDYEEPELHVAKESKYTKKIQELFSEENEKPKGKVKMVKKKVKTSKVKKAVKKPAKKVIKKTVKPTVKKEIKPVVKQEVKPNVKKEIAPVEMTPQVSTKEVKTKVEEAKPEAVNPIPVVEPRPEINPQATVTVGRGEQKGGTFRKMLVLAIIVLLLFLAYKYTVPQNAPTGATFSEACTSQYVVGQAGYELTSTKTNEASAFWLDKLLSTTDDDVARDVAQMFSCKDKKVKLESTPDEFDDCEKQDVFVVVSENDLKSTIDSELASCTKIDDMISCSNGYFITGNEAMKNGENPAKLVMLAEDKTEYEFEDGNSEVVLVFESEDNWYSLAMNKASEDKTIVKMFTEQNVNGFEMKYRTQDPRVITWKLN